MKPVGTGPGRVWAAASRLIAKPAVSAAAMRLATIIDRPLLKATNGRLRLSFIIPCLLLRCTGARSGLLRDVPLLYVPDGKDVLLVGSGGGTEREPAWCLNLRAHPAVQTVRGGQVENRTATLLSGEARAAAWRLAVAVYPGYRVYEARLSREIPVFRLNLADGENADR